MLKTPSSLGSSGCLTSIDGMLFVADLVTGDHQGSRITDKVETGDTGKTILGLFFREKPRGLVIYDSYCIIW